MSHHRNRRDILYSEEIMYKVHKLLSCDAFNITALYQIILCSVLEMCQNLFNIEETKKITIIKVMIVQATVQELTCGCNELFQC